MLSWFRWLSFNSISSRHFNNGESLRSPFLVTLCIFFSSTYLLSWWDYILSFLYFVLYKFARWYRYSKAFGLKLWKSNYSFLDLFDYFIPIIKIIWFWIYCKMYEKERNPDWIECSHCLHSEIKWMFLPSHLISYQNSIRPCHTLLVAVCGLVLELWIQWLLLPCLFLSFVMQVNNCTRSMLWFYLDCKYMQFLPVIIIIITFLTLILKSWMG